MASNRIQNYLSPIGDIAGTAGYVAMPTRTLANAASPDPVEVAAAARKYLSDRLVLNRLTDRVYELLLKDLQCQRERVRNYGKGRW